MLEDHCTFLKKKKKECWFWNNVKVTEELQTVQEILPWTIWEVTNLMSNHLQIFYKDFLLHSHNSIINIRKYTLIHSYHLNIRLHCSFSNCLNIVLYRKVPVNNHVLYFVFMSPSSLWYSDYSLITLQMVLQFGFFAVSSWFVTSYASLRGISQTWCCILLIAFYYVAHDFNIPQY